MASSANSLPFSSAAYGREPRVHAQADQVRGDTIQNLGHRPARRQALPDRIVEVERASSDAWLDGLTLLAWWWGLGAADRLDAGSYPHRFMHPTALVTGGPELLLQRLPEAKSAIADREFGRDRQTTAFQIGQKLSPGLGTLAKAGLKADQFLPALGRGANQNQDALLFDFHPGLQVHAVGPDVDPLVAA